jgi:regulator of sigma E protease
MSDLLNNLAAGGWDQLFALPHTIIFFLIVLTVLVFVHELGHYLVARRNGVRVEVFSIGFGPELFGWWDRAGTRWKVSAIPLGGYVKMFGDADAASAPGGTLATMTEEEKAVSFHHKRLGQRAAIVAAGPIANFLFAILIFAALFATVGQAFTPPVVGQVLPGSPAEQAGLQPKDVIVAVDGRQIDRFEDLQQVVHDNSGTPMQFTIRRNGREVHVAITPQVKEKVDIFGNTHRGGQIGVSRTGVEYVRRDPATALVNATEETWNLTVGTLAHVWQMVIGARTAEDLGGPIRIAQMSGEVATLGPVALIGFMAVLSINLGLINFFPIPVLDGGHLLFYAAEAVRGRPLGQRAQEYGFRIGLALVVTLMVFATVNDIARLKFW